MKKIQAFLMLGLLSGPLLGQNIIPAPGGGDRPQIDVESYDIQAEIDPDESQLRATVEIRFVQLDRQSYAVFDLDRRLRVEDVYLGETEPLPARFRQFEVDSTIEVDLSGLGQFDQPVIRVEYAGRLGVNPDDPEPAQAGIDANGAFLLEEGKWYPMNGVRRDPARMTLDLSVPDDWQVVSALPAVSRRTVAELPETEDVEIVFRPAADVPPLPEGLDEDLPPVPEVGGEVPTPTAVPEAAGNTPEGDRPQLVDPDMGNPVAAFFAGRGDSGFGPPSYSFSSDIPGLWGSVIAGTFERVEPPFVDGSVEALVSADSASTASEVGQAAAEMFRFFSGVFGPPAAPVLRLVEVSVPDWEGQSSPGMLLLPPAFFRSDFDPWELAAHVAEQWFPLRFQAADPVGDAWITEGLGVFAGLYYFDETLSEADASDYVRRALIRALSYEGDLTLRQAGSLPRGSAEYRALAGYKGGFIFRMLREIMGPELFPSLLDEFRVRFSSMPVTTSALIDLASDVQGEDLSYFFSQWLDEPRVPEFEREYRVLRLNPGGYKVEGRITQDLDLFSMPVEIEVITDGEPEYQTVFLSGPASDIDIVTERKPRSMVIDPKMKVLRMSPDILVAVHISRGEDLANAGKWNDAINEYNQAVDLDRLSSLAYFRMGEALFELNALPSAADMFREALNGDLEPTWIEVWAYINVGKIYDLRIQRERALIEYQKAINTGDDAYGAQAAAQAYMERPFRAR